MLNKLKYQKWVITYGICNLFFLVAITLSMNQWYNIPDEWKQRMDEKCGEGEEGEFIF